MVGQLVADMLMQVFIERVRRIAHRSGYIQLILRGGAVFSIRIYGWVDGNLQRTIFIWSPLSGNIVPQVRGRKY